MDGPSGAGKSTVAAGLATLLRRHTSVSLVPTDHFATWDDPVSWWPRLVRDVLLPLRDGRPGRYHPMDWSGGTSRIGDSAVEVPLSGVILVEGVSSGRFSLRPWLTYLVWVELADAATRLARSVARDGERYRSAFVSWQRFETGWFVVDGTRAASDATATP